MGALIKVMINKITQLQNWGKKMYGIVGRVAFTCWYQSSNTWILQIIKDKLY